MTEPIMTDQTIVKKSLGIAICAYKGHIPQLKTAFDSIEQQTRKPDMVIVSCSSSEQSDIPYKASMYSFPLMIITHRDKKNAAQNRNFAAALLQTDIVSFFDADDIMHPQRLQIIEDCFIRHNVKIFLHNTTQYRKENRGFYPLYSEHPYILNLLGRCYYGTTMLNTHQDNMLIANGHVSVSADVLKGIQFNDTSEYYTREDTKFCTDVIIAYHDRTAYCNNILSYYIPSGTGGYLCE